MPELQTDADAYYLWDPMVFTSSCAEFDQWSKKKRLSFFHQEVEQLMQILNVVLLIVILLIKKLRLWRKKLATKEVYKLVNITFDTFTEKVTDTYCILLIVKFTSWLAS
jgi:hypothetical protein